MDTSLNKIMHAIQNKKSISERNITDVMKFIQNVPDKFNIEPELDHISNISKFCDAT